MRFQFFPVLEITSKQFFYCRINSKSSSFFMFSPLYKLLCPSPRIIEIIFNQNSWAAHRMFSRKTNTKFQIFTNFPNNLIVFMKKKETTQIWLLGSSPRIIRIIIKYERLTTCFHEKPTPNFKFSRFFFNPDQLPIIWLL